MLPVYVCVWGEVRKLDPVDDSRNTFSDQSSTQTLTRSRSLRGCCYAQPFAAACRPPQLGPAARAGAGAVPHERVGRLRPLRPDVRRRRAPHPRPPRQETPGLRRPALPASLARPPRRAARTRSDSIAIGARNTTPPRAAASRAGARGRSAVASARPGSPGRCERAAPGATRCAHAAHELCAPQIAQTSKTPGFERPRGTPKRFRGGCGAAIGAPFGGGCSGGRQLPADPSASGSGRRVHFGGERPECDY